MARKGKKKALTDFYAQALTEAEKFELSQAEEVEGLDEEIALLRLRLKEMLNEHPENISLFLRGVELLMKAVSTKYRLSKDDKDNLGDAVSEVLKDIGGAILPETMKHLLG
jgi:hypothetical protein